MSKLLQRLEIRRQIERSLARAPVTALVGPRQAGKTKLAQEIARAAPASHYFDLKNLDDLRAL